MGDNIPIEAVEHLLRGAFASSSMIGGLEFYGVSTEFKYMLRACSDLIGSGANGDILERKLHIFLEDHHGKTSLSKALDSEATRNGVQVFYLDGTVGLTQKSLRELKDSRESLVLLDGLPESAPQRAVILERFNSLTGKAILFSHPDYRFDALLDPQIQSIQLSHIDERPLDKLAWLIGFIRESIRDTSYAETNDLSSQMTLLPLTALVGLSRVALGPRISQLRLLASMCANAMRLRSELSPGESLSTEDLTTVFLEFYATPTQTQVGGFRVWVEGDTDSRLLKLVAKLGRASRGFDVHESLSIIPLGEGRDGGTSRIPTIVVEMGTRRYSDLFLFDCDPPGRSAKEKLQILEQDAILLDPQLSCSRCDIDVEIEDFISLSCLDRFYQQHPDYLPEKELIKYKLPVGRRLVVEGKHKEVLINWLEANAEFADVENMFYLLCEIRQRFSLRNPLSPREMSDWKRRLQVDLDVTKHVGNRPSHWSP